MGVFILKGKVSTQRKKILDKKPFPKRRCNLCGKVAIAQINKKYFCKVHLRGLWSGN